MILLASLDTKTSTLIKNAYFNSRFDRYLYVSTMSKPQKDETKTSSSESKPDARCTLRYTMLYVTQNEPKQTPALLSVVKPNDDKSNTASSLWKKIQKQNPASKHELLPKDAPALFQVYRSEKGVETSIITKEPRMPIEITQFRTHVVYEWKIQDGRGIHNALLSEVNEYTLKNPNGRMVFYDPITQKDNLGVISITLDLVVKEEKGGEEESSITYGGAIPGKEAFVYITFKRFAHQKTDESVPTDETIPPLKEVPTSSQSEDAPSLEEEGDETSQSEDMPPLNKAKTSQSSEESDDSNKEESSQDEEKENKPQQEGPRPLTLGSVIIIVPNPKK